MLKATRGKIMIFCDRCFIEYEDEEVVQFDKESPKWICIPCKHEFDWKLKVFLIEFFNSQPERLSESALKEDAIV
jgi:hypothetical protein